MPIIIKIAHIICTKHKHQIVVREVSSSSRLIPLFNVLYSWYKCECKHPWYFLPSPLDLPMWWSCIKYVVWLTNFRSFVIMLFIFSSFRCDDKIFRLVLCIILSWINSMKINVSSPAIFVFIITIPDNCRGPGVHANFVSNSLFLFCFQVKNKNPLFLLIEAPNWIMFMSCCFSYIRRKLCSPAVAGYPWAQSGRYIIAIRFVDFIWFVSEFNER